MMNFVKGMEYKVFGKGHDVIGIARLMGIKNDGTKAFWKFYPSRGLEEALGIEMSMTKPTRRTMIIANSDSSQRQYCQKYIFKTDYWLNIFSDNR